MTEINNKVSDFLSDLKFIYSKTFCNHTFDLISRTVPYHCTRCLYVWYTQQLFVLHTEYCGSDKDEKVLSEFAKRNKITKTNSMNDVPPGRCTHINTDGNGKGYPCLKYVIHPDLAELISNKSLKCETHLNL